MRSRDKDVSEDRFKLLMDVITRDEMRDGEVFDVVRGTAVEGDY